MHIQREIETPYSFDDLWDNEELCCKIQTIQHSDVLYIFNEAHPVMTLKRYSNIDWRLEELELKNGPFLALNTSDILIKCNENLDEETILTASGDLFTENDVGRLVRLRIYDDDTLPWASNINVEKDTIYCSLCCWTDSCNRLFSRYFSNNFLQAQIKQLFQKEP